MLSAIAARKLAEAALQGTSTPSTNERVDASSPSRSASEEPLTAKPPSKRKSSSRASRPPKRKKKEKRTIEEASRYFADSFKKQEDVILVDSDDDGSVLSGISDDAQETVVTKNPNARAWSPSVPLRDSSDEEGAQFVLPSLAPLRAKAEIPRFLSTFTPVPNQNTYALDSGAVSALQVDSNLGGTVVTIQPSETLCLLGTYTLYVLQGSITLSGVPLAASPRGHHVYAPRSSPLPVMKGTDGNGAIPNIRNLPPFLTSLTKTPVALVLLQDLNTGVEGLGRICRTFDRVFEPSRWQKPEAPLSWQLSRVHLVTHQTKDIQAFELPISWEDALNSPLIDTKVGVHFVKGPKKSGKSTFARTLMNRLLTRYRKVAFLECDLGQSEFAPAGMVALNVVDTPCFGPPFTHPTLPNLAHYIGASTPRSSPSHYLAAVQSIIGAYRLDLQTPLISTDIPDDDDRITDAIPLVVNTMGWHKGLGADLTLKIQDMVEPTDIYEIEASSPDTPWALPSPSIPVSLGPMARIYSLQPIPASVLSTNYTATDHRSLSILSYLHANFPSSLAEELEQITAKTWDTSLPLCARPPYEVDCAESLEKIILTGTGMEDVVASDIHLVLNGAVVGLVTCDPGSLDGDDTTTTSQSRLPYTQGFAAPSPATSRCHGLALIRSISSTSTQMHVLTPLPRHLLGKSKVIVKGELDLPIWGMLDFRGDGEEIAGAEKTKVPYLQWGKGEGLGGERRRIRRNLMRRGQV